MVDRFDIVKASIEADKRELTFTDELIDFLKELNALAPGLGFTSVFRVSLEEGCFFLGYEDEEGVTTNDTTVYDEKDDPKIVCSEVDFDILRGATVDYELHGLSKQIVFKDERFKRPFCCGELHPMMGRLIQ